MPSGITLQANKQNDMSLPATVTNVSKRVGNAMNLRVMFRDLALKGVRRLR